MIANLIAIAGVAVGLASLLKAADTFVDVGPKWGRRIMGVIHFIAYPWSRGASKSDIDTLLDLQVEHAKKVDGQLTEVCLRLKNVESAVGISAK